MGKVFIEESTLTSIGDAIRTKSGSTELIAPLAMAEAITNLPAGAEIKHVQIDIKSGSNSRYTVDLNEYGITDINQIIFMAWPNYYSNSNYGGFSVFSPYIGPKVIGRTNSSNSSYTSCSKPLSESSGMLGGTPTVENGVFRSGTSGYMNCICGPVELVYI